jgi:hypothetical protein
MKWKARTLLTPMLSMTDSALCVSYTTACTVCAEADTEPPSPRPDIPTEVAAEADECVDESNEPENEELPLQGWGGEVRWSED